MDIRALMAQVPEMDRFLTLDELNADLQRIATDHPELATSRRVGTSKLGEPIDMLSIGSGAKNAFLFACPHPNEPIGAMLVHHLAYQLVRDAELRDGTGYTWHLIGSVDPDGTRLNEGWFAGPFTPRNYARHFYRPSSDQQVEWTFPISYKKHYFDRVLPETQMLMRVIDELKPELMASLHNAGFGGVYYYISHAADSLYETLHAIPGWEDLPLQLGEAEVPYAQPYADAIYPTIKVSAGYDYMEENGVDPATSALAGGSSFEYSLPYDTFSIITEVAYYDDPRVNDQTPSGVQRREAILRGLDLADEGGKTLRTHFDAVAKDLKGQSPFQHSVDWWANLGKGREAERNWAKSSPETERPATVAELFSSIEQTQFYRLLGLGMLLRMLEGEIAIGNGTPAIRAQLADSTRVFTEWADKLENSLQLRAVPIRKLVSVQLGAILAAAEYLAARRTAAPPHRVAMVVGTSVSRGVNRMAEIDRKTEFFEALLHHTPVHRRAFVQRAAALGLAGPAALRLGGSALAQDATPAASTQKGGDGTLIVTVGGDPLSFNPNFQVDDNAFVPACNIYNTLVTLDSSYAILPELATSWETTADGLKTTFTMVDNAKWHDGQPVTSADVKYTFDTIMTNASATASSFFSSVASTEAPDATTFVLNMKQPSASLISFLGWYGTHILPAHIYDGTDWTTNPANQNPVGSGPFKFNKYEAGASIELDGNLDYWGEGPFVDRLVFSITPDPNTAEQALLNGETDVLTVSPPRSEIATLDSADGVSVIELPIPSFYYVQMNIKRQYTSDLEVRKAISMGINRQQIVDVALGGYGDVATTFYPKEIPWAANTDPEAMVPQYDPETAKSTLDAAGYALNGDFRFKLVFIHFTLGAEYADMAAIIKENLKDIGIDVEIVALEIGAFSDRALAGDFDLNVISGLWGPDPENLKIRVGTGGAVNTSFYSNPEVDKLLDEGSALTDQDARAEKYWEVQAILAKDLPISPLATQILFYPHADRVSGLPFDEGIGKVGINRFTITHVAK